MITGTGILDLKHAVRERDGFKCVDCGITNDEHYDKCEKQLHVHRNTPGVPYTIDGCVTLCSGCHRRRHARMPRMPKPKGERKLTVVFKPKFAEAIRDIAGLEDRRVATVIIRAMRRYAKENGHEWPDGGPHRPCSPGLNSAVLVRLHATSRVREVERHEY